MTKNNETRLSEIEKELDDLYVKASNLRCERNMIKTMDFDYIGKYIKYNNIYMFVYDVFPVENNEVLIRGVGFEEFLCEDWDGSYFGWETDRDFTVNIDKNEISIITKEEYDNTLDEAINGFLKHKKEFVDNAMLKWAEYNKNC